MMLVVVKMEMSMRIDLSILVDSLVHTGIKNGLLLLGALFYILHFSFAPFTLFLLLLKKRFYGRLASNE